jgi:hypothetical protein
VAKTEEDRQEFSFEEQAIEPKHQQSIEEEEQSLIKALSFTKKKDKEDSVADLDESLRDENQQDKKTRAKSKD